MPRQATLSGMPAPEIVLVRHGETEWTVSERHTGRTDVPLTENGRTQAKALGARLTERSFGRVLASPLVRARDTCELAGFAARAELRDDLMEIDYGDAEGRTTVQMREDVPGWTAWSHGAPGGESLAEVGARVDVVVDELRATEGDVAIFAHGHILRVLAARWIGLGPECGSRLRLETGSLSVLGWEREHQVLLMWNT